MDTGTRLGPSIGPGSSLRRADGDAHDHPGDPEQSSPLGPSPSLQDQVSSTVEPLSSGCSRSALHSLRASEREGLSMHRVQRVAVDRRPGPVQTRK